MLPFLFFLSIFSRTSESSSVVACLCFCTGLVRVVSMFLHREQTAASVVVRDLEEEVA